MVGKPNAIEQFFAAIAPYESALSEQIVRYVGRLTPDGMELFAAVLILQAKISDSKRRKVELNEFVGEEFSLILSNISAKEFINKLKGGKLVTPSGEQKLLGGKDARRSNANANSPYFFTPKSSPSGQAQRQDRILSIHGNGFSSRTPPETELLAWKFRSFEQPYNGISDLLADFGLLNQDVQLEIIALPLAYIDVTSTLVGETATLKIRTAGDMDKAKVSLYAPSLIRTHSPILYVRWT